MTLPSTLFAAMTTNFDLMNPDKVKSLRETLESIKEVKELAIQQESYLFNPSGSPAAALRYLRSVTRL